MKRLVVAIDGPAGAGKSTVTKQVAARLGYVVVDTGALYRIVALSALRSELDWDDAERVGAHAEALVARGAVLLENDQHGQTRFFLAGDDVSEAIRSLEIGQGASKVSAHPRVRQALLQMQRDAGKHGGVVLEGRDIGTVVFPNADAKFYLTASVDVRARRRYEELVARGSSPDLEAVKREVIERDHRDSNRPIAPLKMAADAEVVDSSGLPIELVVERIVARVKSLEQERTRTS
jgi:cytidylate kinase